MSINYIIYHEHNVVLQWDDLEKLAIKHNLPVVRQEDLNNGASSKALAIAEREWVVGHHLCVMFESNGNISFQWGFSEIKGV